VKIKFIISISGRICSGKSFVANLLSEQFNIPVASFSHYLKDYCLKNKINIDRNTLQELGEKLVKENPSQFLKDTIDHFIGDGNTIIVEGVRHKSIFEALTDLSEKSISVFVDENRNTRFERYVKRIKFTDEIKTHQHFLVLDNHPVEIETEMLKPLCDIVIDSKTEYSNQLISFIAKKLRV
jgi:dephospho-CoA kinase